jgi:hypothetical protein
MTARIHNNPSSRCLGHHYQLERYDLIPGRRNPPFCRRVVRLRVWENVIE